MLTRASNTRIGNFAVYFAKAAKPGSPGYLMLSPLSDAAAAALPPVPHVADTAMPGDGSGRDQGGSGRRSGSGKQDGSDLSESSSSSGSKGGAAPSPRAGGSGAGAWPSPLKHLLANRTADNSRRAAGLAGRSRPSGTAVAAPSTQPASAFPRVAAGKVTPLGDWAQGYHAAIAEDSQLLTLLDIIEALQVRWETCSTGSLVSPGAWTVIRQCMTSRALPTAGRPAVMPASRSMQLPPGMDNAEATHVRFTQKFD